MQPYLDKQANLWQNKDSEIVSAITDEIMYFTAHKTGDLTLLLQSYIDYMEETL